MKSQKQTRVPVIKANELLSVIDSVKWENGYEFSYNKICFRLFLLTLEEHEQNESDEEAEYFESTREDGWDIYLLETISTENRGKKLFHEIAECSLRNQKFSNIEAHQIALWEEEKLFGKREK